MKFSIVIPAYNSESLVGESIESVLGQTFGNFELIVVDDGSTDNTLKICKTYELRDSRIKVIHKKNGGPFAARVAAYSEVTGDYVLHVDADDRLREDALETLASIAEQGGYDVIFFEYSSLPNFSKTVKRFPFSSSRSFSHNEKAMYLNLALDTYCLHNMWSKAVKAQLLLSTSYPSDALHLVSGEDHLQSLLILDRAGSAYYLMDALYFYRDSSGSTTKSFRIDDYRDFMVKAKYFKQLLNKWERLPGNKLSDDSFDVYVLVSTFRYLGSASKYGNSYDIDQAIQLVYAFDMFTKAIGNHVAVHKLRIDMRIALQLLKSGHIALARWLIFIVAKASKIQRELKLNAFQSGIH